jgi:hypothetical protein
MEQARCFTAKAGSGSGWLQLGRCLGLGSIRDAFQRTDVNSAQRRQWQRRHPAVRKQRWPGITSRFGHPWQKTRDGLKAAFGWNRPSSRHRHDQRKVLNCCATVALWIEPHWVNFGWPRQHADYAPGA